MLSVCEWGTAKPWTWRQTIGQKEHVEDTITKRGLDSRLTKYRLKDLWLGKTAGNTQVPLSATIPSHDVLMYLLKTMFQLESTTLDQLSNLTQTYFADARMQGILQEIKSTPTEFYRQLKQ